MAITLRTLADARALVLKAAAEFQADGEDTTALDALTLTEGALVDYRARLDAIEAKTRAAYSPVWDEWWTVAQDEVWARVTALVPTFDNLLADPRTGALARQIMRTLSLRRCQHYAETAGKG